MVVGRYLVPDAWRTGEIGMLEQTLSMVEGIDRKFLVVDVSDLSCCYMRFRDLVVVNNIINLQCFVPHQKYFYDGWKLEYLRGRGDYKRMIVLAQESMKKFSDMLHRCRYDSQFMLNMAQDLLPKSLPARKGLYNSSVVYETLVRAVGARFRLCSYFSLGDGIFALHYRSILEGTGIAIYCKNGDVAGCLTSHGDFGVLDRVVWRDVSGILARRKMMGAVV